MLILITLAITIAGLLVFGISLLPILVVAAKYVLLGYFGYKLYEHLFKLYAHLSKKNKKDDND